jgi:hypothetical protein
MVVSQLHALAAVHLEGSASIIHCMEIWVVLRADLDALEKKYLAPVESVGWFLY